MVESEKKTSPTPKKEGRRISTATNGEKKNLNGSLSSLENGKIETAPKNDPPEISIQPPSNLLNPAVAKLEMNGNTTRRTPSPTELSPQESIDKVMNWNTDKPVPIPSINVETVEHQTPNTSAENGTKSLKKKSGKQKTKKQNDSTAEEIISGLKNAGIDVYSKDSGSKSGISTPSSETSLIDRLLAQGTDDRKQMSPSLLRLYIDEMDQDGKIWTQARIWQQHLSGNTQRLSLESVRIVSIREFLKHLKKTGLQPFKDPRLIGLMNNLSNDPSGVLTIQSEIGCKKFMDLDAFIEATSPVAYLLNKALSSNLIIPEFPEFCKEIASIYKTLLPMRGGQNAQYIPQLARVDPNQLGISICTIDGQRFNIGDTNIPFCIQSCSKALNYAINVAELGPEKVHQHLGKEPSGVGFNQISLDKNGLPHNPMINPGAIACCSVLKNDWTLDDRFDFTIGQYRKMAGQEFIGFSNATFLSEKSCADQNFAIGYFLKEHGVFPKNTNLKQTLDLYFQLCSVEATCESAAVLAATLANGGVCPTTQESCLTPDSVRNTLSLMYSCGLYDYSGEFAFEVGLPGKSGVAGSIFIVVPNLMGICVWSPPLDSLGNSFRGIEFAKMLCKRFSFHQYDCISGGGGNKIDPRRYQTSESRESQIVNMLFAASAADSVLLRKYLQSGVDFNMPDYDGRTALHLSVCGGNLTVVKFLVEKARCNVNPLDRWNSTPIDDGYKYEQTDIVAYLMKKGGVKGEVLLKEASHQY